MAFDRRRAAVLGVCAALLVGGALVQRSRVAAPTVQTASAFRFRFPAGTVLTYDLRFSTAQALQNDPKHPELGFAASLAIDGELVLRSYGGTPDAQRVGLRFGSLSKAEMRVLGQDALRDRAVLAHEAILTFTDRGQLVDVAFAKETPDTFRAIAHVIARAIPATAPFDGSPTWTAEEEAVLGRARAEYARSGDRAWTRKHVDFMPLSAFPNGTPAVPKVVSTASIALGDSFLERLDATDEVVIQKDGDTTPRFRASVQTLLVRKATSTWSAPALDLASLVHEKPEEVASPEEMQRKLREQVVAGLTFQDVTTTLLAYSFGGEPQTGWTTRAVVLLTMHPELAYDLVPIFEKPEMNAKSRGFLLDLLASAGTKEAQDAMRLALSSSAAKAEPRAFGLLLQRFSFVAQPDAATVAFLQQQADTATDPKHRYAALFSLGTTAGRLARQKGGAEAFHAKLQETLGSAKTTDDRKALIAALGNYGSSADVPAIAKYTKDSSPDVRVEVALAMRKSDTKEARKVLVDLLADSEGRVASAAFDGMRDQTLSQSDVADVAAAIVAPTFPTSADADALSFAAAHMADPSGKKIAEAILARAGDAKLAARARMLLGGSS